MLLKFSPICHLADGKVISNSGALRANFIDAFNLIRSFNNTLFLIRLFSGLLNPTLVFIYYILEAI